MQNEDFIEIINHLVGGGIKLIKKYTSEGNIPVEFACIFCQSEKEYLSLTKIIKNLGKIVQDTPTGFTYQLRKPINTSAGELKLVKIRKPDSLRKERGDTDFNTNYSQFKKKYQTKPQFELIKRDDFEMLRLSDPKSDVLVCFSNIPLSKMLNSKSSRQSSLAPSY